MRYVTLLRGAVRQVHHRMKLCCARYTTVFGMLFGFDDDGVGVELHERTPAACPVLPAEWIYGPDSFVIIKHNVTW